jgi:predicted glutamine amidotransferase
MCKVAGVVKINDENRDKVWAMMIALGDIMSKTQRDGLGYAAFDKAGNIFGERWLENDLSFKDFSVNKKLTPAKIEKLYNFFGESVLRQEAQAIILHARIATCGRGLANTHPFVDNIDKPKTAIIHNGIIANDDEHEKKFSTCDSEVLVHLYEKFEVSKKLENVKKLVTELIGWFTVLNLSKDAEGRMIMDIYTDAPRLNSYFVKELDTRVYSTSAYDIEQAAKLLDFTISDGETARPNSAYRIDVLTGNIVDSTKTIERKEPKFETYEGIVVHAEGNLDDEKFRNNFLGKRLDPK